MKNYSLTEAVGIFCNVDDSTVVHLKFHFNEKTMKGILIQNYGLNLS